MLKLAGIAGDSIVDGPGIRTTLFAQGCPHHCTGCHNPETWSFEGGTEMTEEQAFDIVMSNPLSRGVTFSGGEPFSQAGAFAYLGKLLKEQGYEIASYTGFLFEELLHGTMEQKRLLQVLDVLVDGPFIKEEKTLELAFRGSRNQRILDVPESLRAGRAVEITHGRWQGEY